MNVARIVLITLAAAALFGLTCYIGFHSVRAIPIGATISLVVCAGIIAMLVTGGGQKEHRDDE